MNSNEIRQRFLDFFEERGHRVVRSSSLVPAQDPTLLFSNAGMNQFKDVFLGREQRDFVRACTAQKCVRAGGKHNDLEQVGRTTRHHTFFEMLGNFSFGDYFKKEAIPWAWELITEDFAIPREKLYVTVFREDDEAGKIWANWIAKSRIFYLDEKDNFWAMGETGPCGPCSEIHFDLGPAASDLGHGDCPFPCDCGRYVELWNLVFMQFNRDDQGTMTPLPRPSIDTGAGLERLAAVLQGKLSNFDTDLFRPLIEEAASLANVEYGANHDTDVSLRIIADHARAATFLISDGVVLSNEGRGYVLRLILRRALYHGQTLGLDEPFMFKLSGRVVDLMKDAYPELAETAPHVAKAIKIEEERYAHTTRVGLERLWLTRPHFSDGALDIFEKAPLIVSGPLGVASAPSLYRRQPTFGAWVEACHACQNNTDLRKMMTARTAGVLPGSELFRLHDTFGLRPDFVEDVVRNYGLTIDRRGYEAEMAKQRERARAFWKGAAKQIANPVYQSLFAGMFSVPLPEGGLRIPPARHSEFVGYGQTELSDCVIYGIIQNGQSKYALRKGDEGEIILDRTPFYAEAGGQVGDTGHLYKDEEVVADICNTYQPVQGVIVHRARIRAPLQVGDRVTAVVDAERRASIRRNHTATHLLHAALRQTLGTHVKQAGSLVAPDRLRFDFTHYSALDEQDLLDIEDLVNRHVLANDFVEWSTMDLDTAVNSGATALFGEKYGDQVRVVSVKDFSKELCGGTHVRQTGDIGLFKIISEGSVAAGIRRIEALTGEGLLKYLREASETLVLLSQALRAKPDELLAAVEKLSNGEKKLRKELEALQMKRAAAQAGDLVETATEVKGVRVVAARVEAMDRNTMRQMVDELRPKLGSGVIVLGTVLEGKVALIAAVTQDLTKRLDAGKIVKAAAAMVEGSGGGRKDLAEAGGKDPDKLDECLAAVPSIVEKML